MEYEKVIPTAQKAEIQKVQKTVKITDHRSEIQNIATHSLSLTSSTGKDSRDEQKISSAIKKDLEQNTTDIPVVRQRQVLAIHKAPRTAHFPLLQYIDTTVDIQLQSNAEKTPQRQHEDCMTKYNEIQLDKKLRQHKLRTENEKQNDTEVIHREVKGGTKTKCYLMENQSEFSETRRRKDLVKKHSEFDSVTLTASAKRVVRRRSSRARSMSQSESSNRIMWERVASFG